MLQQRTRVKICGLTRQEDIASAVCAGADAIGLVFYAPSSRCVSLAQARTLRDSVPAMVDAVALFVNAPEHEVQAVIDQVQPDLLQFHGDETPEFCARFKRRYLRSFRLGAPGLTNPEEVLEHCQAFSGAAGWLFDSYSAGYGGSGVMLDASLLRAIQRADLAMPMIIAGGLNADTVGATIRTLRPFAVDVSSGVEVSGGVKSAEKINAFMAAVKGI